MDTTEDGDDRFEEPDPVPDPEADLPDPERELPYVPEVSIPSAPEGDAPPELARQFWVLVVVCNGALLALALGAMFVGFRGDWDLGGRLLFAGVVLSVYAYYRYRTFPDPAELRDDPNDDPGGDASGGEDDAADTEDGRRTVDSGDGDRSVDPAESDRSVDPDRARRPAAGTVEDDEGRRYVLVKRSGESSLVRDPDTGEGTYLPNDRLERVEASPLSVAAGSVPDPVRRVLTATHDDRSLGLLVEVVDQGGVSVRSLLDAYDLCESDLHGLLAEFRAAGLVEETTVAGQRGYEPTETAVEGVAYLREDR